MTTAQATRLMLHPADVGLYYPEYHRYVEALLTLHGRWQTRPASPQTVARAAMVGAEALLEARSPHPTTCPHPHCRIPF